MRRRPESSLFVSIALHIVIGAGLVRVLAMPVSWRSMFERGERPVVERIGFLSLPKAAVRTPGRNGGDGRPVTPSPTVQVPAAPMPVAPVDIPVSVPRSEPSEAARVVSEVGSGPIVGVPGPVRGIRPAYSDPRVWASPDQIVSAPLSSSERLDSALNVRLQQHQDSMDAAEGAGPRRAPGDWTVEKNGKKYGMDSKYIRLGKVSIPTTLLALLPLNLGNNQGNVAQIERERALGKQRIEIMEQAQRAMNEEDFRKAVRAIRERKQRERERLLATKGDQAPEKQKTATP